MTELLSTIASQHQKLSILLGLPAGAILSLPDSAGCWDQMR